MRAIVVRELGSPEVLRVEEVPEPVAGPGEVLVALVAIGVNFAETERRRGLYDRPSLPWIPGKEGAGTVVALGEGVAPSWLGARVAFWTPRASGTYAERATAPVTELFVLPPEVSFEAGAALPLQGLTAWGLAHQATRPRAGQSALVHAAAGGVGSILVQLLRQLGLRVFGSASSPAKRLRLAGLGAEPLASDGDWVTALLDATDGRGVDWVFDSVGRATQQGSLAVLARQGHLVCFGEASGPPAPIGVEALYARDLGVSAFGLAVEDDPAFWQQARRELLCRLSDGTLRLEPDATLALGDAAEAHRRLEGRATAGKLVLRA
jgi:NADPH:quinone reductase